MPIIKLSKIMKEVVEKTTINNQYTVLTSSKNGLVDQSIYFNKQVASKDNIGYKIIKRGQYTYRSMSDTGYFYINRLKNLDVGIVSPAYPVFELFTDLVIPEYLDLYFNSDLFQHQINSFSQGSTRLALKFNKLITLEIYVPSLEIQKKIVKKIDLIRNLKQNFEQNMNSFDDLVKSQFIEMFGDLTSNYDYPKFKIDDLAFVTKLAGFEFTEYINYQSSGDIIMLRGLNCKNGKLVLDDIKWIDVETSKKLPRSQLFNGDILMTYAGTVGDVALVDEDDKYHLAPNVAKISLNDKSSNNPIFFIHLFMFTKDYILSNTAGVAQMALSMKKIRDFEYHIPPIELQNKFANFVQQIDKSKYFKELPIFITIFKYIKSKLY